VERRRKEAKRRDTECAEIRRRDRNRFRGKGAACPPRIASGLPSRLPSDLRVNRTSSVNRVKGKPFEAPFLSPFGSQGKQGKRGKHREW